MRPLYLYDLASVFAHQIRVAEGESDKVYEAMIGIVADNKDPLKLGRVKVKIPVLKKDDVTWWAPIIMLGAGKNRGWFFIPEKDDEVLLMFDQGHMDHPLVVGALWNGKDKPPDHNRDNKNGRRVIKSRAGSRIVFDDDKGEVIVEDGAGIGIIKIESGSNKITIEAKQGDVCLQAPAGNMQIVAKEANFTAGDNLELHAGSSMAWDVGTAIKINGGQGLTLSGPPNNNMNCGAGAQPTAPQVTPEKIADPYEGGSGGGDGATSSGSAATNGATAPAASTGTSAPAPTATGTSAPSSTSAPAAVAASSGGLSSATSAVSSVTSAASSAQNAVSSALSSVTNFDAGLSSVIPKLPPGFTPQAGLGYLQDNGLRPLGVPPVGIKPIYMQLSDANHVLGSNWFAGQFEAQDGPNGLTKLVPVVSNPVIATEVATSFKWEGNGLVLDKLRR